jgi:hypothetical protein
MLALKDMLLKAGYPEELIWAPSYLGTGIPDIQTPHTDNVNEVREFIDNVRDYLGGPVVDIIAHSLGCTLAYAIFRGLKKQTSPVVFDQPKKWSEVGTFVALAGAFHGFGETGPYATGEWKTSGEFMSKLLTESVGGGGETPYGSGKPKTPSPPREHNITYFCGIARGDFVDNAKPDTGKLAGAINKVYNLGAADVGHKNIKESATVFKDFLPYLNSVPPVAPVTIAVDKDSGSYATPFEITVHVQPSGKTVHYVANKVSKAVQAGILVTSTSRTDKLEGTLHDGDTLTISANGMWEVVFSAEGTDDVKRTYWLGVEPIEVSILTDNSAPFEGSLDVMATTTRGTLYHSLTGDRWSEGSVIRITSDATPQFIAIDSDGIASQVASKSFKVKPQTCERATAVEHYVLKRIDTNEFLAYGQQFGFTTPFTLCLVNGRWVPQINGQ